MSSFKNTFNNRFKRLNINILYSPNSNVIIYNLIIYNLLSYKISIKKKIDYTAIDRCSLYYRTNVPN